MNNNFISSSGFGTVINYDSGSDFYTSYGSGSGSTTLQGVHMKGVLLWLFRWAADFCHALAALVSPIQNIFPSPYTQGVTKRCRLFLLTNSALVYESQCGGMRAIAGSRPMISAVHIT